ncbi:hypothetical protein P9112_010759 [Eukaryota sp. TZLM1-RC]
MSHGGDVTSLKREYDDLKRTTSFEISELRQELERVTLENTRLAQHLESSHSQDPEALRIAQSEIVRLKTKVNKLHSGWTSSTQKYKSETEQLAANLAQCRAKASKLQKSLNEVQGKNDQLEAENVYLKSCKSEFSSTERNLLATRDVFKNKNKELSNEVEILSAKLKEKDSFLEEYSAAYEQLKTSLEATESYAIELEECRHLNRDLMGQVEELKNENLVLSDKIQNLEEIVRDHEQNIEGVNCKLTTSLEQIKQLETDKSEVEGLLTEARDQSQEMEQVNTGLVSELQQLVSETDEMRSVIDQLTDEKSSLTQQVEILTRESTQCRDVLGTKEREIGRLEEIVLNQKQKIEEISVELNQAQSVAQKSADQSDLIAKLEQEVAEVNDRHSATRRALFDKEKELEGILLVQSSILKNVENYITENNNKEAIKEENTDDVIAQNDHVIIDRVDVCSQTDTTQRQPSLEEFNLLKEVITYLKSKLSDLTKENSTLKVQLKVFENRAAVISNCLMEIADVDASRYLDMENQLLIARENGKQLKAKLERMEVSRKRKIEELELQIASISENVAKFSDEDVLDFEQEFEVFQGQRKYRDGLKKSKDFSSPNEGEIKKLHQELEELRTQLDQTLLEKEESNQKIDELESRIHRLNNEFTDLQEFTRSQGEQFLYEREELQSQITISNRQNELLSEQLEVCKLEKADIKDGLLEKINEAVSVLSNIANGNQSSLSAVVTALSKFEERLTAARRGLSKEFSPELDQAMGFELRAQAEALSSVLADTLITLENTRSESSLQLDGVLKEFETVLKDYSQLPSHLPKVKEYRSKLKELRRKKMLKKAESS